MSTENENTTMTAKAAIEATPGAVCTAEL